MFGRSAFSFDASYQKSIFKEDPEALFEYRCNRNALLFHQFQIVHFPICSDHTDNIGCLGQVGDVEAVVVAVVGDLSALHGEDGYFGYVLWRNTHHCHLVVCRVGRKARLDRFRYVDVGLKAFG